MLFCVEKLPGGLSQIANGCSSQAPKSLCFKSTTKFRHDEILEKLSEIFFDEVYPPKIYLTNFFVVNVCDDVLDNSWIWFAMCLFGGCHSQRARTWSCRD